MFEIYNDDCFKVLDELIEKNVKVDMILVDLPYGKTQNNWDIKLPMNTFIEIKTGKNIKKLTYEEFVLFSFGKKKEYIEIQEQWEKEKQEGIWDKLDKLIKNNCAVLMFGQGDFTAELINSNKKLYRYNLVWEKNKCSGHLNANRMPLPSHEDIVVFYKNLPTYNPQKTKGKKSHSSGIIETKNNNYGNFKRVDNTEIHKNMKYPKSILKFAKVPPSEITHPTEKPIELIEYLIKTYSNENDIILDFTAGSGTTGVAAIKNNRKCILIEKEKEYFDIVLERLNSPIVENIEKKKSRPNGIKYKKSTKKQQQRLKQLESLIYSNFNLTNKDLAKKLDISEMEFYRAKLGEVSKRLKNTCKQQSLF